MTGLSGSLKVISFPALVRFLADLRRTGCLRLTQGRWTGEVYFDRGQVVAAAFGAEQGPPALAAILLALGQGQFAFAEGAPPPARTVDLAGGAPPAYPHQAGAGPPPPPP